MADNEFNPTKTYGVILDQRRTKLSRIRSGQWRFFDPASLRWVSVNSKTSYVIVADNEIGIVTADKFDPKQYIDLVKPGETLVRSISKGAFTYHKLPKGAELV
jgi:hypothetical protein